MTFAKKSTVTMVFLSVRAEDASGADHTNTSVKNKIIMKEIFMIDGPESPATPAFRQGTLVKSTSSEHLVKRSLAKRSQKESFHSSSESFASESSMESETSNISVKKSKFPFVDVTEGRGRLTVIRRRLSFSEDDE